MILPDFPAHRLRVTERPAVEGMARRQTSSSEARERRTFTDNFTDPAACAVWVGQTDIALNREKKLE
jgi:hypothetical protein